MEQQKLLIIGFSCTETEDGYATFLTDKLSIANPSLQVLRCALGGLAPPVIPAMLRQILTAEGGFTHVLLEISTSIYPWLPTSTEDQAEEIVRDTIDAVFEAGASPFFLLLHRSEEKRKYVDFDSVLRRECQKDDIYYLDLSRNMELVFGRGWYERHYRDDVHTNEAGGRSQASIALPSVISFLNRMVSNPRKERSHNLKRRAIPLSILTGKDESGNFKRKDLSRPYIVLQEEEQIDLMFDKPKKLYGVSFVMGPWSGNFKIELVHANGVEVLRVAAFDERSYYPRLGYRAFSGNEMLEVSSLRIFFSDRATDVELMKGDRNPFPCEIRVVDLFAAE